MQKKYNILKNISICLIIFSILDNFGFGGGRNGFIYFQGIGKQDIAVAVLFLITAILIYLSLISNKLTVNEFFIISLLSIFIIQLKVSGFPILFFYMFMIFQIFRQNKFNYKFISTILTTFFIELFGTNSTSNWVHNITKFSKLVLKDLNGQVLNIQI